MLLTRRGVSRGFTVMTPRQEGGGAGSVRADARMALPMAFFMGVGLLRESALDEAEGADILMVKPAPTLGRSGLPPGKCG